MSDNLDAIMYFEKEWEIVLSLLFVAHRWFYH